LRTLALACETIRDEIKLSFKKTGSRMPIYWVESGLHNSPERLRRHLQKEIALLERRDSPDYILLLFGYCGNALLGLTSSRATLVVPRVDDCISLLLGGNKKRDLLNREAMAYYLTKGWLRHKNNLWYEHRCCLYKYGPEQTERIYRLMLGRYENLNVIKTGAYDLNEILPLTRVLAEDLGLQHRLVNGSLRIIHKALLEEWDDDFAVIKAGLPVSLKTLKLFPAPLPRADSGS
jgi:hypothetical protein